MNARRTLAALTALVPVLAAFAQAPAPAAPDAAKPAPPRRVHPMAALMANPAAWVEPEHFIAVVNEGGAADAAWLAEFLPAVEKYCQLRLQIVELDAAPDASPAALLARARAAAGDNARAFLVLADDFAEPILTAPGSGWAVMSPAWVTADKSADDAKTRDRLGKQFYRALGLMFGAGFRIEREAVLRDAPTPAALDEALSRNFHPQNLAVVQAVAQRLGLEMRRLKSRSELEAMGLLKPREPKPEPAPEGAAPAP